MDNLFDNSYDTCLGKHKCNLSKSLEVRMNSNKKKALIQTLLSVGGIVSSVIIYLQQIKTISKVIEVIVFLFFILMLIDGLKRLFKRTAPTTMGRFDG